MRIDAHQHFWQLGRFVYPWMPAGESPLRRDYLPEDLRPILERNRFDGTVAVQATHDTGEVDWLLDVADANELVKGVVGWVDLTRADLPIVLDAVQKRSKFKGVRHLVQDDPDDRWLLRPDVIRGLKELERRDIPYDLLLFPRHLPIVLELVERVPRLRMVIDHVGKPPIATGRLDDWARDIERVAASANIWVKLSGMITEADHRSWKPADLTPYVTHALTTFGPDRCMFGSDWPVCLLAGSWKQVLAAFTQASGPLPVGVREKILGGTAARFYGLESS